MTCRNSIPSGQGPSGWLRFYREGRISWRIIVAALKIVGTSRNFHFGYWHTVLIALRFSKT